MNERLMHHFSKTLKVVRSCKTEEQLTSAKKMIHNFVVYWVYQNQNKETISGYVKCLNLLLKHKQNNILGYE